MEEYTVREVIISYKPTEVKPTSVKEPKDIADFLRTVAIDNSREHFIAIYLDGSHRIITYRIVSLGTINMCQTHPREVYQPALLVGAVSVIVAHNHPSGELTPSAEDHKITNRMREAAQILGLNLLDHIIFSDTDHYSFKTNSICW